MENRLFVLYQLQHLDDQLDKLEELRGDLPLTVNDLKSKMESSKEIIESKIIEKSEGEQRLIEIKEELSKIKENIKKYKSQLYQVRNNREYDALTKEIDSTELEEVKLDAEEKAIKSRNDILEIEIEDMKPEYEKLKEELELKNLELDEIIKANQKEEEKIREKREAVADKIKKSDLNNYTRIRKACGGTAIAYVYRNACSACNNVIPSQRQLEIKASKRLYTCESCGRYLVSPEITEKVQDLKG